MSTKTFKQKPWKSGQPLISVVMPSYNYGKFIQEALQSLYNQTFQDFEIIIVDCSDDPETINVIKNIEHSKVKVFFREGQHFVGDNRNYGISRARGKYYCTFDPDDKLKPTYLEKLVYVLETENRNIVCSSVQVFGAESGSWVVSTFVDFEELLQRNLISVTALTACDVWRKAQGYRDKGLGQELIFEDWDFWIRAMGSGARVRNVQEKLFCHRHHEGNQSTAAGVPDDSIQRKEMSEYNSKFTTPKKIDKSRQLQREKYLVSNSDINLFRIQPGSTSGSFLLLMPEVITEGLLSTLSDIKEKLSKAEMELVLIYVGDMKEEEQLLVEKIEEISPLFYPLTQFLYEKDAWGDFFKYLLKSSSAEAIHFLDYDGFSDSIMYIPTEIRLEEVRDL